MIKLLSRLRRLVFGEHQSQWTEQNEAVQRILKRRSVRKFLDREVPASDLQLILDAGRFAPSSVNLQTWSFICFSRQDWQEIFNSKIPFNGSYAIVVCADLNRVFRSLPPARKSPQLSHTLAVFNVGLAAMNMTIAAEFLGLHSIMLSETGRTGILDLEYLHTMLNLPNDVIPLTTLVLGYAAVPLLGVPPRFDRNTVIHNRQYQPAQREAIEEWLAQMKLGFQISTLGGRFEQKTDYYMKRFAEVESVLSRLLNSWKEEDAK